MPARKIDHVILKGKKDATTIYEIADWNNKKFKKVKNFYERALLQYQSQNWQKSIQYLNQALQIKADDGPSVVLKERCQLYQKTPPESGWKGVFSIATK